jgi:hypothetical protein
VSNELFQAIAVVIVLAHVGALVACFALRRGARPVVMFNALASAGVLVFVVPYLLDEISYGDLLTPGFCAFELLVLTAAVLSLRSVPVPAVLNWIGFAINLLISICVLAFAFLFQMKCCGYL